MEKLDPLDKKILFELDRNSRQPISELARTIRHGRDQVEYRIEQLIKRKVIRKFVTHVNPYRLGFTLYKTYLRFENIKSRIAEFILYLQNHPRIYWIAHCDGSWDLIVAFFARDAYEFHTIHTTVLSEFNEVVLNFNVCTLVNLKYFGRSYLARSQRTYSNVGGELQRREIDKIDFRILRLLSDDARLPSVCIGDKVGLSHQMIRHRIERMEKEEIITGYGLEVDLSKLGMLLFKTQFFLRNYQLSLRQQLLEYCAKNPHITCFVEQVADCNLEIELEVNSYEQYSEIIDEIRGSYSKLVRNFQSMLIRKTNLYSVPKDLS